LASSILLTVQSKLISFNSSSLSLYQKKKKKKKAIESKETEDDTQWLSYWTVYASFNVVEYFSSFILRWIPFYYFAKISFLVWCFLPSTKYFIYLNLTKNFNFFLKKKKIK